MPSCTPHLSNTNGIEEVMSNEGSSTSLSVMKINFSLSKFQSLFQSQQFINHILSSVNVIIMKSKIKTI